ncbi:hypothetical protein CYLTODRAFT_459926 [Cylindrobasidium torrendii FP15055 ss-10]|uniref:Uncharacterized protein n=1 Tax=Cylindrobasidium torrendii FP15055 ss-10 TaxID=1314674 RepID=A0A0D7AU31_9AGAR|nr:hypothetical protein CYLTODRAFT_459926 [Cylindrobasidium torrendii FP15055 ss-10]
MPSRAVPVDPLWGPVHSLVVEVQGAVKALPRNASLSDLTLSEVLGLRAAVVDVFAKGMNPPHELSQSLHSCATSLSEILAHHHFFTMPPEVHSHILLFAQTMVPPSSRLKRAQDFGLVCRYWHKLVEGIPDLWNTVLLSSNPSASDFEMLSRQSTYGRDSRITLYITQAAVNRRPTSLDAVRSLLNTHRRTMQRISHIEAREVNSTKELSIFLPLIITALYNAGNFDLRTLSLPMHRDNVGSRESFALVTTAINMLHSSRLLRLVTPALPELEGYWSSALTCLALSTSRNDADGHGLISTIGRASCLQDLVILERRGSGSIQTQRPGRVTMPSLISLRLRTTTVERIDHYLRSFVTPALCNLLVAAGSSRGDLLPHAHAPAAASSWPTGIGMQFLAQCNTQSFASLDILNISVSPQLAASPVLQSNHLIRLHTLPRLPVTTPHEVLTALEQRLLNLRQFGASFDLNSERDRQWLDRVVKEKSFSHLDNLHLGYVIPHRHRILALHQIDSVGVGLTATRVESESYYPDRDQHMTLVPSILEESFSGYGGSEWGRDFSE